MEALHFLSVIHEQLHRAITAVGELTKEVPGNPSYEALRVNLQCDLEACQVLIKEAEKCIRK